MPIPDVDTLSLSTNLAIFAAAGVVVWIGGTRLGSYADTISERTQVSKAFLGLILLGVATSLPEIATTITASLLDNASLVAGNLFGGVAMQIAVLAIVDHILGTNCLEVALFFLADGFYRGGPILAATDNSAIFAASIGLVVTCIYLVGLLERRDRTFLRMGYDSVAVLVAYTAGLMGLYFLG